MCLTHLTSPDMPSASLVMSVGLDISKNKIDIHCCRQDDSRSTFVGENSSKGIFKIIRFLKKQETGPAVPCVIESTGDFHLLSACMIAEAGFTVNVINPLITKKYQRSSIRNAKTDPVDAKRLAEIGILEKQLPVFSFDKERIVIKKHISTIATMETSVQRLRTYMNNLKRTAKQMGFTIDLSDTAKAIKHLEKQISLCQKQITAAAPIEAAVLAEQTKGVSQESLAIIFGLLGDKAFTNRNQLTAFAGLDVTARQSGMWFGKRRVSKRGNPFLRKILYQIAWGLKQHNDLFKQYYHSLRLRKLHYTSCLLAVARKFLRFLFAYYWKPRLSPTTV